MEIQKTEGIILNGKPSGEADYIIKIFTKDYGRRSYIFKGIKKSKKRAISIIESGTVAEIICYFKENKSFYYAGEFSIISTPRNIRKDMDLFFYQSYILELLLKTTADEDPHLFLYNITLNVLKRLENEKDPELLLVSFIIHLINYHGIFPDISSCDNCGNTNFQSFQFSLKDKIVVCDNCSKYNKTSGTYISSKFKDFYFEISNNKYDSLNKNFFNRDELLKAIFYLTLFIEDYFHVILNSKDFILKN